MRTETQDTGHSERLSLRTKLTYGLGDHTINLTLSVLSLFYLFFLTEHAGLRPALASAVLLVGRGIDAFSDPLMGRLSDLTRSRWGRRRPYFLFGCIPFGICFALLWSGAPLESQLVKFAYYASLYSLYSLASTVLAVPYIALLPELTSDYQERTSLSSFRSAFAVSGTLVAAVTTRPLVATFGGEAAGFAWMGVLFGIWVALPWFMVFLATREREHKPSEKPRASFAHGLRLLARHNTYRRLCGMYLFGRMAMDVAGAMFIYYFDYWLQRPGDHPIALGSVMLVSILSLPLWLRIARHTDKHQAMIAGAAWWIFLQIAIVIIQPDWPRWIVFACAACTGVSFAVLDLMPWSMLADVIDEDELRSGERREGLYAGFFMFLRKLSGAGAVAAAGIILDLSGYVPKAAAEPAVLLSIRGLTGALPALLLACSIAFALRYPLSRAAHAAVQRQLAARRTSQA